MITKCPVCGTLFRVTLEQLRAREGRVRCGRCMSVFDGAKALAAAAEQSGAAGATVPPAQESAEPAPVAQRPHAQRATAAAQGLEPESRFALEEDYSPEQVRATPASRWWVGGAVLLGFLLAGQAAHFYRTTLATQFPGLKPHLVRLCQTLGCSVLPPSVAPDAEARRKQISIEASDLQVEDPARPGIIQLTATVRNHAGHDLAYPAVDLVLTNTKDHTLARRIFLPHEYLEVGKDVAAGIPGSAEITVRLVLDTGELNPAGFRLDLLPAPAP